MAPSLKTSNGDRDFACASCGANKVFEIQLLSTLVNYLKCSHVHFANDVNGFGDTTSSDRDVDGETLIDFGTVMVFSCEKSCWNDADPRLMQETIVLQEEPGKEFSRRVR